MDQKDTNQHYISQVLLKRFRNGSERLHCFEVATGRWRRRSAGDACSATGYNQLVIAGEVNNAIENEFSKIESKLPSTLKFLDGVAASDENEMPPLIHENLYKYCSFLKLIAPYEKHGAIVAFNFRLNNDLNNQDYQLLRELGVTEKTIKFLRELYLKGGRVTVEAENLMQQVFCFQFGQLLPSTIHIFQNTMWTICNSPVDLPMSDIGIVPIHHEYLNANQYLLPIGPKLLLEGLFNFDESKNLNPSHLRKVTYTPEEAQNRIDCICASALEEIICSNKMDEIPSCISRAMKNGISFHKIVNPGAAKSSGLKEASSSFGFKVMSIDEYKHFSYAFVLPRQGSFLSA